MIYYDEYSCLLIGFSFVQSIGDGEGKSTIIARSPQNRKKNRFANISVCKYTFNYHDINYDYMPSHYTDVYMYVF